MFQMLYTYAFWLEEDINMEINNDFDLDDINNALEVSALRNWL